MFNSDPGRPSRLGRFARLNTVILEEAAQVPGVTVIDTRAFIAGPEEITDVLHFHRAVYFRIYQHIMGLLAEG